MKHIFKFGFAMWLFGFWFLASTYGQAKISVALLIPENSLQSQAVREQIKNTFSSELKILDDSQADVVIKNEFYENLYNLSTEEAQRLGNSIGCNFFVILKAENLRRAALSKKDYYESYASIHLVSSRTGRLVFWTLKSFEAENLIDADKKLSASFKDLTNEISGKIKAISQSEINENPLPKLAELPGENSPETKNFRSPLPFKRLRPAYTSLANLYNIAATIDALVDLDETGKITQIEIIRWAGYELDESVAKTIREMQWRPALRDGKTLPIRVLLRYNFKKIEKDE